VGALLLLAGVGFLLYRERHVPASPKQRTLTRITFDDGLQIGATWSPDGRFIAYGSDRGGKFDIWVQQVSGGDPVQITKGTGHHWQPDWSPDGKYIAYRSVRAKEGYTWFLRWAEQDWNARFRRLDIFHAGHRQFSNIVSDSFCADP